MNLCTSMPVVFTNEGNGFKLYNSGLKFINHLIYMHDTRAPEPGGGGGGGGGAGPAIPGPIFKK